MGVRRLVWGMIPWLWGCAFGSCGALDPVAEPPGAPLSDGSGDGAGEVAAVAWASPSAALDALWPALTGSGCDLRAPIKPNRLFCVVRPINIETLLGRYDLVGELPVDELRWLFEQSAGSTAREGLLVCRVETREPVWIAGGRPQLVLRQQIAGRPETVGQPGRSLANDGEQARGVGYFAAPGVRADERVDFTLHTSKERWTLASFDESGVIVPAKLPKQVEIGSGHISAAQAGERVVGSFGAVECRVAPPALVARRAQVALDEVAAQISAWEQVTGDLTRSARSRREALRDPLRDAVARVVALVGWADARLIALLERGVRALAAHDEAMSAAQWAAAPAVAKLELDGATLELEAVSAPRATVVDPPDDLNAGIPPDRLYVLSGPLVVRARVVSGRWTPASSRLILTELRSPIDADTTPAPPSLEQVSEQGGELGEGQSAELVFGEAGQDVWLSELHARRVWRVVASGGEDQAVVMRAGR